MESKKIGLVILDGWGLGEPSQRNAIHLANTPVMDSLMNKYPNATLRTDGENVGLPDGQMGNSEVGHINIGAGRVVYQDFLRINKAIESGEFQQNQRLKHAFLLSRRNQRPLHLMGLVSTGGVHSHENHLMALLDMISPDDGFPVYVHAFTDGRDTDPNSGLESLRKLAAKCEATGAKLCTVVGRYYSMDRDERWERIKLAYDAMLHGVGESTTDPVASLQKSYDSGVTDEFVKPLVVVNEEGVPNGKIDNGDTVVCFNFRTDRCRQITRALTQEEFSEFNMKPLELNYFTMTRYDDSFKKVEVIYEKDNLDQTLGKVIADAGKGQIRLAETEKYPHVTFFLNGGREEAFDGESRKMANSPKVATYDLQPEMSANELVALLGEGMSEVDASFFCLNFANPDMVGHTGVKEAVIKAVETTDSCLGKVLEIAKEHDFELLVIADHGNADMIMNEDGSPNTAHTTNPVPVVLVTEDQIQIGDGILADVAPTILERLSLSQPEAMTGNSIIVS